MAFSMQVTCINKRYHQNAHERITHIGGSGWKHTEADAITWIEAGIYSYYVVVNGWSVSVEVATHNGRKYLKTKNDGYSPDNLLSLPECS